MAKPEWGVKRICPSCGAQYDPEALLKSRRARPAPADDVKKVVAPVRDDDVEVEIADEVAGLEDVVEDDVADDGLEESADDGDDDVLIEDTSELGEDDMEDVVALEPSADDDER